LKMDHRALLKEGEISTRDHFSYMGGFELNECGPHVRASTSGQGAALEQERARAIQGRAES
jgi:hypothetical protein